VLDALGPRRGGRAFGAYTDWQVAWRYAIETTPGGVRVGEVSVDVRAAVVVPRWRPPRSAPAELAAQWSRYVAAIELHEQGHVDLAVAAGRAVLVGLEGLPTFAGPDALRRAADALAEAEVEQVRARERAYDDASRHGASQGVAWPETAPCDR
jgi:predicted secreted Zn-dependent protease